MVHHVNFCSRNIDTNIWWGRNNFTASKLIISWKFIVKQNVYIFWMILNGALKVVTCCCIVAFWNPAPFQGWKQTQAKDRVRADCIAACVQKRQKAPKIRLSVYTWMANVICFSAEVGAKNWFSRSKERRKSKGLCAQPRRLELERSRLICPTSNQIVPNQSRINHSHGARAEADRKTASLIAFPARPSFRRQQLPPPNVLTGWKKSDLGAKQWILTAPIPAADSRE